MFIRTLSSRPVAESLVKAWFFGFVLMVSMHIAVAEQSYEMIFQEDVADFDSLSPEPIFSEPRLPPRRQTPKLGGWSASIDSLWLSRTNRLGNSLGYRSSSFRDDLNEVTASGYQLRLTNSSLAAGKNIGSYGELSFTRFEGADDISEYGATHETDTNYWGTSGGIGATERTIGGSQYIAIGIRYDQNEDVYKERSSLNGNLFEQVETSVEYLSLESIIGGNWRWKRLVFQPRVTGGFGAARWHRRQQDPFFNPFGDTEESIDAMLVVSLDLDARYMITDHASVAVGYQFLGYGSLGTLDENLVYGGYVSDLRLNGISLGARYDF